MKRGLTILTAALFAGALALPAMAQSTDNGMKKEAPVAGAVTNPTTTGSDAVKPAADENAAKVDSGEMNAEQKPAEDSSQPKQAEGKADTSAAGDAVTNPAAAPGHTVE